MQIIEVAKLQRDRSAAAAGGGMLDFDLRVEDPLVIELVADIEDRALGVGLVRAAAALLEQELAVATDRQALGDVVDLGSALANAALCLAQGRHQATEVDAFEVARERANLLLQLLVLPLNALQALFDCLLRHGGNPGQERGGGAPRRAWLRWSRSRSNLIMRPN